MLRWLGTWNTFAVGELPIEVAKEFCRESFCCKMRVGSRCRDFPQPQKKGQAPDLSRGPALCRLSAIT